MPGNIKSFERIVISHFDMQTLNFLRQIGTILTNVNLNFIDISLNEMDNLRILLDNLVPLLNGINSLSFDVRALPTVEQCFANKIAKIKVLEIYGHGFESEAMDEAAVQAQANILLNWLLPAQDDNGSRLCRTNLTNVLFENILSAIRQDFLAAKTPRTFALELCLDYGTWRQFVEFHLQNGIGEEMHGVKMEHGFLRIIQITRHPANRDKELQEWIEIEANITQNHQSRIEIRMPTIGLIDGMDAPVNADENQQPSTSKKA